MPRYTCMTQTFVNGTMAAGGDVVEYDGWPGSSLEPADDVAVRVKAAFVEARRVRAAVPRKPDLALFAPPPAEPVVPVAVEPEPADPEPTEADDSELSDAPRGRPRNPVAKKDE